MFNELIIKRDNIIKKKVLLEEELKVVNIELKQTEQHINKLCQHNWITDFIDKPYGEGSMKIIYCEHCYLNKL